MQCGVVYNTSSYTILYVVTNINHITHTQNENPPYAYIYVCVILNVCVVHVLCTVIRVHVCVCVCVYVCVRACVYRVKTLAYLTLCPRSLSLQGGYFGILNALLLVVIPFSLVCNCVRD